MSGTSAPDIIIMADRLGSELEPLSDRYPVPLLPVATRSLLDLCLESLIPLAPRSVDLVISAESEQVRRFVGSGRAWGFAVNVVVSRGEEPPASVLGRGGRDEVDETLVLRADMFRVLSLTAFLVAVYETRADCVEARAEGESLGAWFCRSRAGLEAVPGWPLPAPRKGVAALEMAQAHARSLDSLADYHRANMQAAAGAFPDLVLPGRQAAPGLLVGRGAQCAGRVAADARVMVGAGSRVMAGAELSGTVVVSDNVIVDRDCSVNDTLILSHSYVGAGVELQQAIVCGNELIRVDTGSRLQIVDAFLLADLRQREFIDQLRGFGSRVLGVLLLLASLPLWVLAGILAVGNNPRQPFRSHVLMGNFRSGTGPSSGREAFRCWQWNTQVPLLRELPRLLAVISGRLRLLGPAPLSPEDAAARTDDWQFVPDRVPAGLLGPTQLLLEADAPLEERLLSDTFFSQQRSLRGDLLQLLRGCAALFSARAWREVPSA